LGAGVNFDGEGGADRRLSDIDQPINGSI
jgi:hypothetical protein